MGCNKVENLPEPKKFSLIKWRSTKERPENARYVMLQCRDEYGDLMCVNAAYEKGHFFYIYDQETWGEINEAIILGWSYYPFDDGA